MAVTVDPFIPKLTKLLFEKTMVPPACSEPRALMVRPANDAVMVPFDIPKETLFELAKTRVPELMDEVPAENHCTRSEFVNRMVAAWLEFQSDGLWRSVLVPSATVTDFMC